jgi:hypothetical protein
MGVAEEFQELHEHAEHAANNRSMAPVSMTLAVLAVLVAIASLLGHRTHTEEVVLQTKANDQWAYFQAKDTRLHIDQKFADFEAFASTSDPTKAAKSREANQAEADKYRDQKKDIESEAKNLEKEAGVQQTRADRYDLGEVFLEIGLVVTSITLLSGKRSFWYLGMLFGVVGIVAACTSRLVH